MSTTITRAKSWLMRAARVSGLSAVVSASSWRSARVLVLCYHGISMGDEHEWDPALFVSQEQLRRRMQMLRDEQCSVLSLDDAVDRCRAGTLPPRSVVLTFDDGNADFASRALPVLQEFQFPATVYLTTYYCDRDVPVPNVAASYLLWKGRDLGTVRFDGLANIEHSLPVATAAERHHAIEQIRHWMRRASTDDKTAFVEQLSERVGYAPGEFFATRKLQIMSAAEVSALPSDLVTVELHTHRHQSTTDHGSYLRDLTENDAVIRSLRDRAPHHFCYPSGCYRSDMRDSLEQLQVRTATTCTAGLLSGDTDLLCVPRLVDSTSMPDEVFRAWISGTANLMPRRG